MSHKLTWRLLILRVWQSAVFIAWGAMGIRMLGILFILPMVLAVYTPEEASIWFLLQLIFGLVAVAEFGLSPTFTRLFGYALGGARVDQLKGISSLAQIECASPDIDTLRRLSSTLRATGFILCIIAAILFFAIGNISIWKLNADLPYPVIGWAATEITLFAATISVWGQVYISYLQGMNRILDLRRWEFFTSLGQLLSMVIVLAYEGGLLILIAVTHTWSVFAVVRNAWLCRQIDSLDTFKMRSSGFDRAVLSSAWPAMWRSGIAIFFSHGVVQASGLVYAQIGTAKEATSYLFHLRLITIVRQFSLPPFYNKIPQLSQYIAGHRFEALRKLAKRGMALAYWSFTFGFILVGIASEYLLPRLIGEDFIFDPILWLVFGLAFYVERHAGMHIQLHMLTNRMILHWLNISSGLIYIFSALLLVKHIGALAFPVGYVIGLAVCYIPFSSYHSYKTFALPFPSFEIKTSLLPFGVIILYVFVVLNLFKGWL